MSELERSAPSPSVSPFDEGGEHWSARDLMPLLGYSRWQTFEAAVDRAKAACRNSGASVTSNFADAHKVSQLTGAGNLGGLDDDEKGADNLRTLGGAR